MFWANQRIRNVVAELLSTAISKEKWGNGQSLTEVYGTYEWIILSFYIHSCTVQCTHI